MPDIKMHITKEEFEKAYAFYREHIGMDGHSVLNKEKGEVVMAIAIYAKQQSKCHAGLGYDAGYEFCRGEINWGMNMQPHSFPNKEEYLKKTFK